ncbi:MAG: glycosyl transferase, group 1 [Cytophagaceae bacterium]|nr:glycosyl transferase, group 1 [Cytophagaceae bacterium]
MVVLYLYSELVGYQIPVLKQYVEKYKASVHVISWDKNRLKPYQPPAVAGVTFLPRSKFDKKTLFDYCKALKPDIVYVSGWMDKDYLHVTKYLKKQGVPVLIGFDDMWHGTLRQRIGALVYPFLYKKYFSHAWVSGVFQFEFARRLGFRNDEIVFDLLTANTEVFTPQDNRHQNTSKSFLYVGNFRSIKGTDILAEAFKIYREKHQGKWDLVCVGNGEMQSVLEVTEHVQILPFSDENKLKEIASKSDVFILPSRHDQWGVVVHEFSAMGLPLLLSENVGAQTSFLIEGFNGLLYKNNSAEDLALAMKAFSDMPDKGLHEMRNNSIMLSKRISIETAAANFMSVIYRRNNG